ncbi:MAG: HD domain-containing phosphohydrolase [Acidobacteriota bacterium]
MDEVISNQRIEKLTAVLEVGKALMAERDLDTLLRTILSELTRVVEADRSSLYLVDRDRGELKTKIAQGMGIEEIRVKIGMGIAGYVAETAQPVNITDAYSDPRFSQETDRRTGYQTRNMLCVPMINKLGDVIGVCQVLNKHDGAFTKEDEELLLALAGQAAVAVENAILYEDIQTLFEGFIRASVYAIESRDPTTSGHSERVATLTVELSQQVDSVRHGPYAGIRFSRDEIREIRYAALLHDLGKVGVREPVLVKAKKLYEGDYMLIQERFGYIKKSIEADICRKKVNVLLRQSREEAMPILEGLDEELKRRSEEIDDYLRFVAQTNLPMEKSRVDRDKLYHIAQCTYRDAHGADKNYLSTQEVTDLSIGHGSLNAQERQEIESHVTHTFHYLRRIPWTRDMRRIPAIAYAHHEKLNGRGYPNGLRSEDIPLQSKIMTICDIYDALTASDRPYKRALTPATAIDILGQEARGGLLDPDLLDLFVEAKVYTLTHRQPATVG